MTFTHIPDRLETAEFLVRPIVVADTALDYAAVMESREFLRPWEQTGWPSDDFTFAEDLADVEGLEQRHREGRGPTFTVLTPDESECLGCVYLMPPDATSYTRSVVTPLDGGEWSDHRAIVSLWVRTSRLTDGLDARLLDALRDWFARDWDLDPYLFATNEQVPQQLALFEAAGMRRRFTMKDPAHSGAYVAFAP